MTAVHALTCDCPTTVCQGFILRPPDGTLPISGHAQTNGWTVGDGHGTRHPNGTPRPQGRNLRPACSGEPGHLCVLERGACPRCGSDCHHRAQGYTCSACGHLVEPAEDDDAWDALGDDNDEGDLPQ